MRTASKSCDALRGVPRMPSKVLRKRPVISVAETAVLADRVAAVGRLWAVGDSRHCKERGVWLPSLEVRPRRLLVANVLTKRLERVVLIDRGGHGCGVRWESGVEIGGLHLDHSARKHRRRQASLSSRMDHGRRQRHGSIEQGRGVYVPQDVLNPLEMVRFNAVDRCSEEIRKEKNHHRTG
jgi:hypothetical protein